MNSFQNKVKVTYKGISGIEIIHMISFKRSIFPRKCITYIDSSIYKAKKLLLDNDSESLGLFTVSFVFMIF